MDRTNILDNHEICKTCTYILSVALFVCGIVYMVYANENVDYSIGGFMILMSFMMVLMSHMCFPYSLYYYPIDDDDENTV